MDDQGAGLDDRLFVSAAGKTLSVLEAFCGSTEQLSLKEIAERTKIGKSAAQRYIYSLKSLGYIEQNPKTSRYSISVKILNLTNAYILNDKIIRFSIPYLIEARNITKLTVNLFRLDGEEIILAHRVSGQEILNTAITIGARFPVYATAPGRAMLSYLPPDEMRSILAKVEMKQITACTLTRMDEVIARVEQARRLGYAVVAGEAIQGNISIGAAIHDRNGAPIAAISITTDAGQFSHAEFEARFASTAIQTVRAITAASGGRLP